MPQFPHIYLCPSLLAEQGFDLTGMSDSAVWRIIWGVSSLIDGLTQQWFNGDHAAFELDTFGRRLISHPSTIPIIVLDSLELSGERTNFDRYSIPVPMKPGSPAAIWPNESATAWELVEPSNYVKHKRHVEAVTGTFPNGPKNVRLTGALGWVQRPKNVRTTTVTEVESDTTEIELTTVSGISRWDVVDLFNADGEGVRVMVTAIDRTANTITIDPPVWLDFTLLAGADAYCFGAPPLQIQDLAGYFFSKYRKMQGSNEAGEVPLDDARIRRERTDDYEYELFGASVTSSGMGLVTGNLLFEEILHNFSKPGGVYII